MDMMHFLTLLCYFGPTPFAGLVAGWQAIQCKSPVQAFFVGLVGTVALAGVFGSAAGYLQIRSISLWTGPIWQLHLMVSPALGLPLGAYCAYLVNKRNTPTDQEG